MALPTAMLNQMAQSSPSTPYNTRKRHRESEAFDVSSSKKRATSTSSTNEARMQDAASDNAARTRARKSITRLPQRTAPEATPPPTRKSKHTYDHLESPQSTRGKSDNMENIPKAKKIVRRLQHGRVQAASPFKGAKFGALDELRAGAILTSADSPAKNTRARKMNPLERLKLERTKQLHDTPTDTELEHDKELNVNQSVRPQDEMSAVDDGNNQTQRDSKRKETSVAAELDPAPRHADSSIDPAQRGNGNAPDSATFVTKPDMSSPPKGKGTGKGKGKDKERAQPRRNLEPKPTENADQRTSSRVRPENLHPRRGRQAIGEEERNARREAEAQKRRDNAEETEAAELARFDRRSAKFVEGIEDAVEGVGGIEAWSKMGGGAHTIAVTAMKGKNEMDTTRSEAVWRPMRNLSELFTESGETGDRQQEQEEKIAEGLRKLHSRANTHFLAKGDEQGRGDPTVVDIFLYLIPKSVFLLKDAIRERFHPDYKSSWQEIKILTEVSISLCETASRWTPKPSTLETGIRKQVRSNIRPCLEVILEAVIERLQKFEQQERIQRNREELLRFQQQASTRRHALFKQMQARMASCQIRSGHDDGKVNGTPADVVDIEDLEDQDEVTQPSAHQGLPSRLRRQGTEEIPAPDPLVEWTKNEEYALLNGLQKFRGIDRYTRILERYSWLAGKDIDQCMARAQYYKQAYRHELAEKVARGDQSSDWLASV